MPNPLQWQVISDQALGDLYEREFPGGATGVDEIYSLSTFAFRCPRSGHLWIFWDGIDQDPQLYSPSPG